MIRSDIERTAIIRDLRRSATALECRAFTSIPLTMKDAADELESLQKVINKRKLKRLRKKGKV